MSAHPTTVQASREERRAWYQHPAVALFLAPFIAPLVMGAASVWLTQSRTLDRVTVVESKQDHTDRAIEAQKEEREHEVQELKEQIVPRAEHKQRWDAIDQALGDIKSQQTHTNERIDEIYKLMIRK